MPKNNTVTLTPVDVARQYDLEVFVDIDDVIYRFATSFYTQKEAERAQFIFSKLIEAYNEKQAHIA